jgi:hypothetical protein
MAIQDEFTTTISFKHDMVLYAQKNWPEIAAKLNEMFKLEPPFPNDNNASFDFFLAVLFIQSRAPYNIYSNEQGERIWKYLINTFAVEPQYGGYANESLDLYSTVWKQYIGKSLNPVGGVASVLLYKLGYKEKDCNILIGTILMDTLMLSPPWWKIFSENNELMKSDIPVSLEAFKIFAEESAMSYSDNLKGKPDGTYQYCNEQGRIKEGWMPPDKIKELLNKSGAKKLTRVLIKGHWEGVKEDFLDVEDATIKKFADDEGVVHAMCHFENGEPKYHYLSKRMWINVEKIEKIIMNLHLSENEKKEQIDKLK